MSHELTIKVSGEAGQGLQTIGPALCRIFNQAGYNIFANQDYMSRVRGGNNYFQLRIADKPIYTLRQNMDITVVLDKPGIALHRNNIAPDGIMVLDKKKFEISEQDGFFFDVPLYEIASRIGGTALYINSVSCGVLAGIIRVDFSHVERDIQSIFAKKSADIIKKNVDAARAGYEYAITNFTSDRFKISPGKVNGTFIMDGNEAIACGAIRAGCKFYSGYPMSPSTGILNNMAHYANRFKMIVEQGEDEISVINMVIGASFTGVRAMAGTAGGGFALMTEGLSLAGISETPIVIVVAQRPAPAVGIATRTEQSDLEFVLHAGHGEFVRAIYTPGTIEEAFYLTIKAFNLAEKYQIPVLIMTDQHLADSERNIEPFDLDKVKVERYIISKEDSKQINHYQRYQFTESGISPRAIPSWINDVIYADSHEHNEKGHITENAENRNKMMDKRFYKKIAGLKKEVEKPTAYNLENAETILIGFGSNYGVMKEASDTLTDKTVGMIHLSQVWPFPIDEMTRLLQGAKKFVTVENNAGAQLAKLMRRETGIQAHDSILKFDGRPFSLDELIEKIS